MTEIREMRRIGRVCELVRYPVKSMAGTSTNSAFLGLHGLDGDRRFAFRRMDDDSAFPWLTASRVPDLLLYHPILVDRPNAEPAPTQVRTPRGVNVELRSRELTDEIASLYGNNVELQNLRHGIFDDASVSVISRTTIEEISHNAGMATDTRRFRANILLEIDTPVPFEEDAWVGGTLRFGDPTTGPAVTITERDVRCTMITFDPDTATRDDRILRSVVRLNDNRAGVYGTVTHAGAIRVGDPVTLIV